MRKTYLFPAIIIATLLWLTTSGQDGDHVLSDFENLQLLPDSYWNGSDLSGGFQSGLAYFRNHYDTAWGAWDQWGYSNMGDDSTTGFLNQYSAITATGYDPVASGGVNYAVAYIPADFVSMERIPTGIGFIDEHPHRVKGFYVTNAAYPALAMMQGDDYSKKFGGESGNDPDFFRLSVWGWLNGASTDTVDFYLADYRFGDNEMDYVLQEWDFVNLDTLGLVDSLSLTLSSSDVGMFGMNTPAYFCLDNLMVLPVNAGINDAPRQLEAKVFPNPSRGLIRLEAEADALTVDIFDLCGRKLYSEEHFSSGNTLDISSFPSGNLLLKIRSGNLSTNRLIFKQ